MARQPQVTRTITATKVVLMAADVSTGELIDVEMTLPREYKDADAILKMATKIGENPNLRYVYVKSAEVVETLYGMTEAEFIKYAKPLPPRAKSEADTESAETSDVENV